MENITNIKVLVLGKNIIPKLYEELGFDFHYNYLELASSLDGKEFSVEFENIALDRIYQYINSEIFKYKDYDICLFIYDLDNKEQVQQLQSFGYDEFQNLEQFISAKCANSFKVFFGIAEDFLNTKVDEENIRIFAEEHEGIYTNMYSTPLKVVKSIIKNYLMQKYKKTDDEITGELTLNDEIKIKFYSVGKDINNTGCYSSYIQKIKNCSIY